MQTSQLLQLDTLRITEQYDKADESLFQTVISDSHHVLHHLLPAIKSQQYKLRPRTLIFAPMHKSSF